MNSTETAGQGSHVVSLESKGNYKRNRKKLKCPEESDFGDKNSIKNLLRSQWSVHPLRMLGQYLMGGFQKPGEVAPRVTHRNLSSQSFFKVKDQR